MNNALHPLKLAELMEARFELKSAEPIHRLLIDSRMVFELSGSVFFALKGSRHNGHQFINDLFTKGIRNFVVDEDFHIPTECCEANFFIVSDVLESLQKLASKHRTIFNIPVVAITGSNGKTIVKEWLSQLIGNDEQLVRSPRSYNSQVGVPLSVWQLNNKTTMAIFEAGISRCGEMQKLTNIIQPNYGLFTNLGSAHQQNFSSEEEKLGEKLLLFKGVKVLFYCRDQELVHAGIKKILPSVTSVTWGKHPDSDLHIVDVEHNDITKVSLNWKGESFQWKIPFPDKASVDNSLLSGLFLLYNGYLPIIIGERILKLQPVAMRMEQKEGIQGSLIINDTYNSDFTSLELALDFLDQQGRKKGMKRTIILSDMFQTGLSENMLYPQVASLIKSRKIDRLIGVGPVISSFAGCFGQNDRFFENTGQLLSVIHEFSFKQEAILIKGSRAFEFENIAERLELKQHSTVMEVNLNALINNLNVLRSLLDPETKVLVMVKAFSYGSGSYEIAGALQHQKVDYLGVAFADEGMELRQAGITMPIMVMNPEEKSFAQMLKYGLEPEIYSIKILKAFNKAVELEGVEKAAVHLKIDTGMLRLGFLENEVDQLLEMLSLMPHLKVLSVFSHLVGSDELKHDSFTMLQIEKFHKACEKLHAGLRYDFWRHILNSAGVERFPNARFEMVRLGIGLYGISAINDKRLENVITLKTYISQIKPVLAGETIGYGRAGKALQDGRIAIIPVGYADGLNRHLSRGRGKVMINKKLVPIIGNICMDMCMVDVSLLHDVAEGDEVVIFGDDYPVTEMARQLDTIPYEVLTGISRRVKRIYFKE